MISVWIPLVDVDERNGCMHLLAGSHQWGLLGGARDGQRVVRMFEDVEQRAKPVVLPMRRGDLLAFSNLTCHASMMNTTNEMRWSVDIRYIVPEAAVARSEDERHGYATIYDHYRMRPIIVASRDPDQVVPWDQVRNLSVDTLFTTLSHALLPSFFVTTRHRCRIPRCWKRSSRSARTCAPSCRAAACGPG